MTLTIEWFKVNCFDCYCIGYISVLIPDNHNVFPPIFCFRNSIHITKLPRCINRHAARRSDEYSFICLCSRCISEIIDHRPSALPKWRFFEMARRAIFFLQKDTSALRQSFHQTRCPKTSDIRPSKNSVATNRSLGPINVGLVGALEIMWLLRGGNFQRDLRSPTHDPLANESV